MMLSVASLNLIKTKVILTYHTKDVSNQASLNLNYEIKSYSSSNSSIKIGINKKREKIISKRCNKGITNQSRF